MKRVVLLVLFTLLVALPSAAQPPAGAAATDPVSRMMKGSFDGICRFLTASAEKMPEENYAFKPTPEVRSFGQIVAHVANTHFSYCARVKGEKNPNDGNDFEKKSSKAEIVKGLSDSIAYCSAVYAGMTDVQALEPLPPPVIAAKPAPPSAAQGAPPPPPQARLQRLLGNITHDWEHYGNLVTYLRLKGLIPPSSEPRR